MMNAIRRWLLVRELRRTPHQELAQQHELLIRLARRCAYDFNHAADHIPPDHWTAELRWSERARHWVGLFQSGNPAKDYRHQLHRELANLESQVRKLEAFITANGLDVSEANPDRMPF